MTFEECDYAIVGGGIAGVSCAETLHAADPAADILVVSASDVVRCSTVTRVTPHVRHVVPRDLTVDQFASTCAGVRIRRATVMRLDAKNKCLLLSDGARVTYRRSVCVCAGGRPRRIAVDSSGGDARERPLRRSSCVLTLRDTQSVQEFVKRLSHASRVVIVGNGGIASELVYALSSVHVVWVIRTSSISSVFVDAACAQLLLPLVYSSKPTAQLPDTANGSVSRWKYTVSDAGVVEHEQLLPVAPSTSDPCNLTHCVGHTAAPTATSHGHVTHSRSTSSDGQDGHVPGSALGPDWLHSLTVGRDDGDGARDVSLLYDTQVERVVEIEHGDWPVCVHLSNGETVHCNFVVSATGVVPNSEPFTSGDSGVRRAEDGGISVDESMYTGVDGVFAAGDVCTASWQLAPHWHQMRLWSQAQEMGEVAAASMYRVYHCDSTGYKYQCNTSSGLHFELFTHSTRLFGRPLVLLGLFNGQTLDNKYTALVQFSRRDGGEFLKVVLREGKVQGALLLGDTDLAETLENLILSQLDVSHLGDQLLSPDVDLEDYFD